MLYKTYLSWHDLNISPDDLPPAEEPIIVTLETITGERVVWLDVYLKELENDEIIFCTKQPNEYGQLEECAVYYPVIAWAYPPDPFMR